MQGEISHKIIMRYVPGILRNQRITFDDRTFEIQYIINPEEMNVSLILYTKELV
jgi:hypothetical protein